MSLSTHVPHKITDWLGKPTWSSPDSPSWRCWSNCLASTRPGNDCARLSTTCHLRHWTFGLGFLLPKLKLTQMQQLCHQGNSETYWQKENSFGGILDALNRCTRRFSLFSGFRRWGRAKFLVSTPSCPPKPCFEAAGIKFPWSQATLWHSLLCKCTPFASETAQLWFCQRSGSLRVVRKQQLFGYRTAIIGEKGSTGSQFGKETGAMQKVRN